LVDAEGRGIQARPHLDGSLVVNIKEGTEQGERLTYVLELILAMRRAGWLWIEEYIWHKH
jgi:site-specific DNA-methyltransferase (adenine-specific)